jgi:hypothetical protein
LVCQDGGEILRGSDFCLQAEVGQAVARLGGLEAVIDGMVELVDDGR